MQELYSMIMFYYCIHNLYSCTVYNIIQFALLSNNISMPYKHNQMNNSRKYNVVVILGSGYFIYIEYGYIFIRELLYTYIY